MTTPTRASIFAALGSPEAHGAASASATDDSPASLDARRDLAALTVTGARPVCDLADAAESIADAGRAFAAALGPSVDFPGAETLSERERLCADDHTPSSGRSLRGATRLLPTADGWVAINLSRPDDVAMLPALTHDAASDVDGLAAWLRTQRTADVVDVAGLLGLALSAVPSRTPHAAAPFIVSERTAGIRRALHALTVLDLSRLWAGPLAGALLAEAGARVFRAIDARVPPPVDPADAAFEARLNGAKEIRAVDFGDRAALADLVERADIVITSMRPSAVARFPAPRPDAIHLMISAHGAQSDRVGFGDDCAVAGGLIARRDGRPEFLGDAAADPLTGMMAAVAALGLLSQGAGGRVDLSLARSAAWAASGGTGSAASGTAGSPSSGGTA